MQSRRRDLSSHLISRVVLGERRAALDSQAYGPQRGGARGNPRDLANCADHSHPQQPLHQREGELHPPSVSKCFRPRVHPTLVARPRVRHRLTCRARRRRMHALTTALEGVRHVLDAIPAEKSLKPHHINKLKDVRPPQQRALARAPRAEQPPPSSCRRWSTCASCRMRTTRRSR